MGKRKPRSVGRGVFVDSSFLRSGDKKRSERYYVKISSVLVHNPNFPFKDGEKIKVRLENGKVTLEKLPKKGS